MNKPISKHRLVLLLMYIGFLLWSLYYYIPSIAFYYDQLEGQATISKIVDKRVHLNYHHKDLDENVVVSFREGNKLYLEKLEAGKSVNIRYSKKFPSKISIDDYHSKPGLGGLVMVVMFLIPLLLFRWIKF